MSELSGEDLQRLRVECAARVAAEQLRLVHGYLAALVGPGWAGGEPAALEQLVDGAGAGRLVWTVGPRQYTVDGVIIAETTIADGRPTRRRTIGPAVIADERIVNPDLN